MTTSGIHNYKIKECRYIRRSYLADILDILRMAAVGIIPNRTTLTN